MPFYHKLGHIPHKRHTQFRKPDGSLYREQVLGVKGFSGIQSILYHVYPPTELKHAESLGAATVDYLPDGPFACTSRGFRHTGGRRISCFKLGRGRRSARGKVTNCPVSTE